MTIYTHRALAALLLLSLPLAGCGNPPASAEPEKAEAAQQEFERGPHNGRMLRDGDFALEMTIFEEGVPPEFHIYAYRGDEPVPPGDVELSVALKRLDGEVNRFEFAPEKDYLRGKGVVTEPHSFDVMVEARQGGRAHRWQYASHEGRVTIAQAAADAAGIAIERAGPAQLDETLELVGRVELDPSAKAEVGAKFPGRVVSVSGNVGDRLGAGRVLARVESSESMQVYSVTSPISGIIVERRTNVGDVAGGEPLFVIADPGRTTAVFPVFPRDMERVRAGQAVQLSLLEGNRTHASVVRDFQPLADPMTGALVARAAVPNPDGFWRPGMSIRGKVTIDRRTVPLAVKTEALQAFRDFTVVFAKVGQTYEVRMLELGRRGPVWTEVLSGIKPGQAYASKGSYVIKADLEKSGASHDH
jgi:membrane fusion protein, heavy metal efflux system